MINFKPTFPLINTQAFLTNSIPPPLILEMMKTYYQPSHWKSLACSTYGLLELTTHFSLLISGHGGKRQGRQPKGEKKRGKWSNQPTDPPTSIPTVHILLWQVATLSLHIYYMEINDSKENLKLLKQDPKIKNVKRKQAICVCVCAYNFFLKHI